jgi:uncharacterized protein
MIDWFIYWFMLPACILIASIAMLTGISGTAMLTPFLLLIFPVIGVPTLTPPQAIGMALFTEFFGFISGVVGYRRAGLIDLKICLRLIRISVPTIIIFSLISASGLIDINLLKLSYGVLMVSLAGYLAFSAAANVRNRDLTHFPEAVNKIPRINESGEERVVKTREGKEYRYRVCDPHRGYLITGVGAAMEGLISVGLGELLMPNLVKRCKVPVAVSAASSVFIIAVTVLTGSLTQIFTLLQKGGVSAIPWNLVLYAVPGAVIGGQLGSKYQGRISSELTERLIAALFLLIGLAFLLTALPLLIK